MSGKPRPCGCKGYRSCLLCEREFNLLPFQEELFTAEALQENVKIYWHFHFYLNFNSSFTCFREFGHMYIVHHAI